MAWPSGSSSTALNSLDRAGSWRTPVTAAIAGASSANVADIGTSESHARVYCRANSTPSGPAAPPPTAAKRSSTHAARSPAGVFGSSFSIWRVSTLAVHLRMVTLGTNEHIAEDIRICDDS